MSEGREIVVRVALIGIGAIVVLDLWNAFLNRFFGVPSLNLGMLGRWFGHFPRGRFMHDNVAEASPIPGERIIGWSAHYAIGITWAALLLAIWGLDWARHPTPTPGIDCRSRHSGRSIFHNAAGNGHWDRRLEKSESECRPPEKHCLPHSLRYRPVWLSLALDAADPTIRFCGYEVIMNSA